MLAAGAADIGDREEEEEEEEGPAAGVPPLPDRCRAIWATRALGIVAALLLGPT